MQPHLRFFSCRNAFNIVNKKRTEQVNSDCLNQLNIQDKWHHNVLIKLMLILYLFLISIILVGVVFNLLNRIYFFKSEETFCVRDRYTKSATATSFIQCKQIIKTVVLSEKLTNIERLNQSRESRKPAEFDLYL